MNIFYKSLRLCLALLCLTACPKKPKEVGSTLVMLTAADNPPFEYYETGGDSNKVVGYDIDLANKIAEYLGYKLEVQDVDFSGIIPGVMHGRGDFVMASLSPTAERKKSVDFSNTYYSSRDVMVTKADSDFAKRQDYTGTTVGAQLGTTQEQAAKIWIAAHPGAKLTAVNKLGDLIQEVLAGRVDAAIIEETLADAYLKNNERTLVVTPLREATGEGSAIAFPQNSPLREKFNEALQHLKKIGFMDELAAKWLKK